MNIGPQKSPSSVNKIEAETKMINKRLEEMKLSEEQKKRIYELVKLATETAQLSNDEYLGSIALVTYTNIIKVVEKDNG